VTSAVFSLMPKGVPSRLRQVNCTGGLARAKAGA